MLAIPPGGLVAAHRASDDSFAFLVQTLPLNTEPGAVATGCKHSTTTETAIKDEFSLDPVATAPSSVLSGNRSMT